MRDDGLWPEVCSVQVLKSEETSVHLRESVWLASSDKGETCAPLNIG